MKEKLMAGLAYLKENKLVMVVVLVLLGMMVTYCSNANAGWRHTTNNYYYYTDEYYITEETTINEDYTTNFNSAVAQSIAAAQCDSDFGVLKTQMCLGAGHFEGENGGAVSLSKRVDDTLVKGTFTTGFDSKWGVGASVRWNF